MAREQGWPRIVPLVSLPHSGGTWLAELLTEVPGYARRPIRDPDGCTAEHDVCQAVFESLPADRLSVVKLHTRPRRANVELLERLALRTVVLDRDLRDQCVSRYFHVLADPWHRHHDHYSNGPKHDALTHSVSVTLDEYLPWVVGWREASARSGTFLSVGYEELRQDPAATLGRILGFLGIDLPPVEPAAIVDRVERRTRFELSPRSLARGSTARRGWWAIGGTT